MERYLRRYEYCDEIQIFNNAVLLDTLTRREQSAKYLDIGFGVLKARHNGCFLNKLFFVDYLRGLSMNLLSLFRIKKRK